MAGRDDVRKLANSQMKNAKITNDMVRIYEEAIVSLAKKEKVILHGFGTFETRTLKARIARNPQNGEKIKVAARTKLVFRPSAANSKLGK